MSKQLFPPEIIEFSSEKLIHDYSKKSRVIYNLILFAIVATFISIFFIRVDVNVTGSGVLRPVKERIVISAPIDGKITHWLIFENQNVRQGDTLLVLENTQYQLQMQNFLTRQTELDSLLQDLKNLVSESQKKNLKTAFYRQTYSAYLSDISERETRLNLLNKRYQRDKKLFEAKVVTEFDFELVENEYQSAKINLQLFKNKIIEQWQYDLLKYENEFRDITAKIEQLENQSERLVLQSPCGGDIQQVARLHENMFVLASQMIAEISPNGELIAECMILPKDIGYIKTGMAVNFQLQAYNYNDWGVVKGEVESVSKDIFISQTSENHSAFFKVKCKLNSNSLTIRNGYTVELQKGLTFSARFVVTQRTVFQLLYDKVDNWLNPALNSITN